MSQAQRILVIEDDSILRDLLADWLTAAGYEVGVAADGNAGIEEARAHRPALVVTDIHMPGAWGATVILKLGQMYPGTPVIAISGYFDADRGLSSSDVVALGAARTFAKPFRRKEMVGAVAELLASRRPEPPAH
jgi:DNA-binding NtrC family response regulator